MTIKELMLGAVERNASDIHLKTGNPPIYRIDGVLVRLSSEPLAEEDVQKALGAIVSPADADKFTQHLELDTSYTLENVARFRVNVSKDDGYTRIVMRTVPLMVKTMDELGLPKILHKICMEPHGLVLVVGPTGCGKSTTLATVVDEINENRSVHIVTIEDPLEFVHRDKKGIVTQREVGHDTLSFAGALRTVFRQDPDVILIGEIRDTETMQTAISAAETGHLVLSTLHTVDAVETLNRIMDFFKSDQDLLIRKQLASVLRVVISQRLVDLKDGSGRCCAAEILIGTRTVRDFIEQEKPFRDIVKLIEGGYEQYGMQTFDQALLALYKEGLITPEAALANASSPRDLKLRIQGLRER